MLAVNWQKHILNCKCCVISTSEQVLRRQFAGRNQFFDAEITFGELLSRKMYKIMQKITKNPGFKEVYQCLGISLKCPKAGRLLRKI